MPPSQPTPGRSVVTTTRRLSPASAERLDAIRRAALEVAEARGYEDFSMQEVADLASVSRTTLYKHYGSKDDLLVDVLRDVWPESTPDASEGPTGGSLQKVTNYALALFDFWLERPNLLDAMVKATVNVDFASFTKDGTEPMYTAVSALVDDVPDEDRNAVTKVLLHVIGGQFTGLSQGMDPADARDGLVQFIRVVLAPSSGRQPG